jgi:hypothetical protein
MRLLDKPLHEAFAQHYARNGNATQAYISAGYSAKGAKQSAARLLAKAEVRARVEELSAEIAAGTIQLAISDRSARVQALQDRWNRLRAVIAARAADPSLALVPGGGTGLIVRSAVRITGSGELHTIYKVDTGLVKAMNDVERQAAQELGQWADFGTREK